MHVLLLPGLACDEEVFRAQRLALQAAGHVCRLSMVHSQHGSLREMAAALLRDCNEPWVLVGVSMGGMLALEIQRQAPQRVAAMALLGTSARPDTPEMVALRAQAIELFAAGRMNEVLRANVPLAFHPDNANNPELVATYLAMVRRAGAEQLITQNRAVMARVDSRPLLPQVRCPVLVLCGQADLLTPPAHAQEMAAAITGAELHLLPGAGHMLTMEQPQQVNRLLLSWLSA